jgi:glycosyltransferase involved in cell wall biosynthesis
MVIVVSSAHYHLSDKYGSEASWSVEILNAYGRLDHKVYAIAGVRELSKPLHKNVFLYAMSSSRSKFAFVEAIKKCIYPFYSFIISIWLTIKLNNSIEIIHHIAPTSPVSYDLFFIFRFIGSKYLIGPAMPPPQESDSQSLSRVLGVKENFTVKLVFMIFKLVTPLLFALFYLTMKQSNFVLAVSKDAMEYYSKYISSHKIKIIPVGINLDVFRYVRRKNEKVVTIVSASYLTKRKGIDLLLESISSINRDYKITNIKLLIVGSGEELVNLKKQSEELQIQHLVDFAGFVENSEIYKYYKRSDIFCSPTRFEPYGISVVEAMSTGLPVVVTDINAMKDIIGSGGYTFEKNNVNDLTSKLLLLIKNKKLRDKVGLNASRRAISTYSWDKIVLQYLS